MFYPSAESSTMGLGLRGRRFFLVCFSFAFFQVRHTAIIQQTEEKGEPRSNEKTIGGGGRGTESKTASIESMKFVL